MIDDPLSLITFGVWLMAAGMYPLGFLFGACSLCCEPPCGFALSFERCMRITRVGNPTPGERGTHLRVILLGSRDTGAFQVASGGGPNFDNALSVGNSPKEVVVPIRVTLSASGSSRTPIGQTRSQVWRFNRTAPSIFGVASTADVAGPPWYLQVDVNVTGITTIEDVVSEYSQYGATVEAIRSALAGNPAALAEFDARIAAAETPSADAVYQTDQHGQVKLVWNIKQGGSSLTADANVTLSLTGFQRWELADTIVITGSLNASLASGASVTGWLVSKTEGLTVTSRSLTVRIRGHYGARGTDVAHYLFNEQGVLDFLNGDAAASVLISDGQAGSPFYADYELLPDSTLCGVDINSLRRGIALGVYPATIARSLGTRVVPYTDPSTGVTSDTFILSSCGNQTPLYASVSPQSGGNNYNDQSELVSVHLDSWGQSLARPDYFWDGDSLLWAVENAPYRTSATIGTNINGFPVTYHLNIMSPLLWYTAPVIGESTIVVRATIRYVGEDPDPNQNPPRCSPCDVTVTNVASESVQHVPFTTQNNTGKVGDNQNWFFIFSPSVTPLGITTAYFNLQFQSSVPAQFPDFRFTSPITYLTCFGGQILVVAPSNAVGGGYANQQQRVPSNTLLDQRGTAFITSVSVEITQPPYTNVEYGPPSLVDLGSWSPVGAAGGTSTLIATNGVPTATTATILPNTGLLPIHQQRGAASTGFVQPAAACSLVGLIALDSTSQGEPSVLSSPQSVSLSQGECRYYAPRFTGSTSRFVGGSSFVSCNGCQPTVQVISGAENASVRIIPSGDREGAIELIASRRWLGGQGVTFSVACGDSTITQTIRRADTVPEPPRNLTVVRGPCSQAVLQWEAPEGDGGLPITLYTIQFRRIGGDFATFGTVASPSLSATVTNLLRLGYEFRVSATNSLGTSEYSNVAVDGFALAAPTGLSFVRSPCEQIELSWTPPPQSACVVVASYLLQFRVVGVSAWTNFGSVSGESTTGTITGLAAGTRYDVRVARVDDAGTQAFTDLLTSGNTPAAPTGIVRALGISAGEVDVAWSASEEACFPNIDYHVQYRTDATSTWSDFSRAASADKFATVNELTAGLTYFFRVRAQNSVGVGGFSTQSESITIPTT